MGITLNKLVAGTLFCVLGLLGVYAIWIEPFMRRYLIKPSPFLLFLIAPILDYPKVRRLSRRRQRTPWFVRVFEVLFLLTTLGMIASLVMYVVMRFKNST